MSNYLTTFTEHPKKFDIIFTNCLFCSNMITLSIYITDKYKYDEINNFLENHKLFQKSRTSMCIKDNSIEKIIIMCKSCSVISYKVKNIKYLLNREITGKKIEKDFSFTKEDLNIFYKELKNIIYN